MTLLGLSGPELGFLLWGILAACLGWTLRRIVEDRPEPPPCVQFFNVAQIP